MNRRVVAVGVAGLSMLVSASAAGAPARDALVRPGRAIGKVTLGMTLPQVQSVLGRHTFVAKRRELGFGEQYLELQWGYAEWSVGVQGRPGALRTVMVATTLRRQRTSTNLGTGSRIRDILRVYPRATCSDWAGLGSNSSKERWIVVTHPTGARTIFAVVYDFKPRPGLGTVVEVRVQVPARGLAEERFSCSPNWRRQ